jgi:hypothetical protein
MRQIGAVLAAFALATATTGLAAPALAAPSPGHLFSPRGDVSPLHCDPSGDRRRSDDCIRHVHLAGARDNKVRSGKRFRLKIAAHRAVSSQISQIFVQYAPVNKAGKRTGRWRAQTKVGWRSGKRRMVIPTRAPKRAGIYAVRLVAIARLGSPSLRGSSIALTSAPTVLGATNGYSMPEDETIIEYFNEINFSEDIEILKVDLGPSFGLRITCPPQLSPTFPPSDFSLTLSASTQTQSSDCGNPTQIVISRAQLAQHSLLYCNGLVCSFTIVLSNRTSGSVYSETLYEITMNTGSQSIVPQLEAASLPIYKPIYNSCLLSNTCQLAPSVLPFPELPHAPYSYNDSVYFQVLVGH